MGRELWTSPVTGHRRTGTSVTEFRSLLGARITAKAVCETLRSCPADAPAGEMAELLSQRDFDVAGVQEQRNGDVIGFVERTELQGSEGSVRDHLRPLVAERLISEATPVFDLLRVLRSRAHAFVIVSDSVAGVVTQWDLNKPPVRVYLFGLISLLEMHLDFWVRKDNPGDSWKAMVRAERLAAAERIRVLRQARNPGVPLFECLQFCDKRDLFVRKRERRESLVLGPEERTVQLLKDAEELRNSLAHSQLELASGTPWSEVIDLILSIEELLRRSDDLVQAEAARTSGSTGADLWPSPDAVV